MYLLRVYHSNTLRIIIMATFSTFKSYMVSLKAMNQFQYINLYLPANTTPQDNAHITSDEPWESIL